MQNIEFIVFEGPWSDEELRYVLRHLEATPYRRHLDRMSSTRVSLQAPVWKFEKDSLRDGSTVYRVSSLVFSIYTVALTLPQLLDKVEKRLQEPRTFGRE